VNSINIGERNLQAALALVGAGFRVFPCGQDKRPLVKGWQAKATTDKATIRRWWQHHPDAMPGLPTGRANGLAVIDPDRKGQKDGPAALRAMGHDPEALSPIMVRTPSGGLHAYFRWPEGLGNSDKHLPPGVDLRGEGGFVIGPGAVNGRGVYESLCDDLAAPLIGLTAFPEWAKPRAPEAELEGTSEPLDAPPLAVLHAALMTIPNDESNPEAASRDWWFSLIAALHHGTSGSAEGLAVAHEWSALHPTYDDGHTDHVWASLKRKDGPLRTTDTILAEAARHGWRDLSAFDDLALDQEIHEFLWGPMQDAPEDAAPPASRLTFEAPGDCAKATARPYVLKGLLASGDVGAIVGAPGVGKSLIGPRLAYAVAQGEPVFGLKTRPGPVLYVAAEDHHGMRGRVAALRQEHGDAPGFALVGGVSSLFPKGDDLTALRAAVKARRPSLIVIDTLAMAFPGLKENEAESMGLVVAAARSLTKWGAAVILIHHDTKIGDGLPRGHSILNGALDVSLHLTRDGAIVRGRPSKNRNGPADLDMAFTIGAKTLGHDEDGDDITAAFARDLEPGEAGPRPEARLPRSASAAYSVFLDLASKGHPVAEADWRKATIADSRVSAADTPRGRRLAFQRALQELLRKEFVRESDGMFSRGDSQRGNHMGFDDDDV